MPGGYLGSDGVNPIYLEILVGDADRQWLEPVYFSQKSKPIGNIKRIIPNGPDHPESVLDACIAFCPELFLDCPTLKIVKTELADYHSMDFSQASNIPASWYQLRQEAKMHIGKFKICVAKFEDFRLV